MQQKVYFEDLGVKSYQPTWDYQESLLAKNTQIKSIAREKGKMSCKLAQNINF